MYIGITITTVPIFYKIAHSHRNKFHKIEF